MSTMIISPQVPFRGVEYTKLTSITWSMGLLHTFNSMRLSNEMCDIKIVLSDKSTINAHSCVLAGASPFLKSLLQGVEKPDINMESFPPAIVKEIIEFIYTGTATVKKDDLFVFHSVSAMLNLSTLTEMAVKLMQNNVGTNMDENVKQTCSPTEEEVQSVEQEDFTEDNTTVPSQSSHQSDSPTMKDSDKGTSYPILKKARVLLKKIDSTHDTEKAKSPAKQNQPKVVPKTISTSRKSSRVRKANTFLNESFETSFGKKKRKKNVEPQDIEIKQEIIDDEDISQDSSSGNNLEESNAFDIHEKGAESLEKEADRRDTSTEEDISLTNVRECDNSEIQELVSAALADLDNQHDDDNEEDNDDGGMCATPCHDDRDDTASQQSVPTDEAVTKEMPSEVAKESNENEDQSQRQLEEAATSADLADMQTKFCEPMQPKPIQVFQRKGNSYVLETVIPEIEDFTADPHNPEIHVETLSDPSLPDLKGKGVYIKQGPGPRMPKRRSVHGIALTNSIEVPTHDGLTFMCEICKRCFTDQEFFERHRDRHFSAQKDEDDPTKRFHCTYCPYKSKYKHLLIEHERTHTGEKPYECATCGRKFSRRKDFQLHEKSHNNVKYTCEDCGRLFNNYPNLRKHIRNMHTQNNRPHKCPICSGTFKLPESLRRHLSTHTTRRPYQCHYCPKEYFGRRSLKLHIEHKHLGTGTKYRCGHCGREYLCKLSMKRHKCKLPVIKEKKPKIRPGKTQEQLIAEGAEVVLDDEFREMNSDKSEIRAQTSKYTEASAISGKVVTIMKDVSDGETSGESDLEMISEIDDKINDPAEDVQDEQFENEQLM